MAIIIAINDYNDTILSERRALNYQVCFGKLEGNKIIRHTFDCRYPLAYYVSQV